MDGSVSGVGVLDKAVLLLELLADGQPRALAAVTAATGLPRATAHRLLRALAVHGLAVSGEDDRWTLGPRLAQLAAGAGETGLVEAARPALARLRDETGESAQLYVVRGDRRVCVASLESPHSLRTIVEVGASLPMDRGSAGTVLADDDPVVQRRGWAQSVEEREKGVASVSAPVRRPGGQVAAAVSVSGPIDRTTRQPGRRYAEAVTAAARAVEAAAGWSA